MVTKLRKVPAMQHGAKLTGGRRLYPLDCELNIVVFQDGSNEGILDVMAYCHMVC